MGDGTGIEWTDSTWNPTTGCDRVTPGCDHCYALTTAKRMKAMGVAAYQKDGNPRTSGPGFGITEHPSRLDQPIRWTRPRRIFVNSMSDLFHAGVSVEFIAEVWAVMALAPQHTFQVLTKRHARLRSVLIDPEFPGMVQEAMSRRDPAAVLTYPLPNAWIGVSVEDQRRADQRIPLLLETPAAIRFLSMEPLLGPVHLRSSWLVPDAMACGYKGTTEKDHAALATVLRAVVREHIDPAAGWVDWVIVGGESGTGARPMNPSWVKHLLDQCQAAGVPFLFKQWGEWGQAVGEEREGDLRFPILGPAGGQEVFYLMRKVGKKAAGRSFGGQTWDGYPAVEA